MADTRDTPPRFGWRARRVLVVGGGAGGDPAHTGLLDAGAPSTSSLPTRAPRSARRRRPDGSGGGNGGSSRATSSNRSRPGSCTRRPTRARERGGRDGLRRPPRLVRAADDADGVEVWTPAVARGAAGTVAEGSPWPSPAAAPETRGRGPRRGPRRAGQRACCRSGGNAHSPGPTGPRGGTGGPRRWRSGRPRTRHRPRPPAARRGGRRRHRPARPRDLLDVLSPDVEVVDVGKTPGHHPIPQTRINEILVEHARLGRNVVRLRVATVRPRTGRRGGDPLRGQRGSRGGGPGVTSAVSVPAAAGIPVTHRGVTASFVVASAHDGATAALDALQDAPVTSTVVLAMGVTALADTARRLVESGRPPTTPVALVESGWTPAQRTTVTTLADAAEVAEREGVRSPAVVVVGEVVRIREQVGDLVPPTPPPGPPRAWSCSPTGRPTRGTPRAWRRPPSRSRRRWPGHVHVAYLGSPPALGDRGGGTARRRRPRPAAAHHRLPRQDRRARGRRGDGRPRPGQLRGRRCASVRTRCSSRPPTSCWPAPASCPTRIPEWCFRRWVVGPRGHQRDRGRSRGAGARRVGSVGGRRAGRWRRRRGRRGPVTGRGSAACAGRDLHGRRGRCATEW